VNNVLTFSGEVTYVRVWKVLESFVNFERQYDAGVSVFELHRFFRNATYYCLNSCAYLEI